MGSSLRKPVAVNNWESLIEEALRLRTSGLQLLTKARESADGLEYRMRAVKSQSLMIRLMLLNQAQHNETRQTWTHTWWDSMESLFTEFQAYHRHTLDPINELEERLLF
jgi:hypothetical protein